MKPLLLFLCLALVFVNPLYSQKTSSVISGPMLGQVELRTAQLWIQLAPSVRSVAVSYWKIGGDARAEVVTYKGILGKEFNTVKMTLTGLDYNTTYKYRFVINGVPSTATGGSFTTQDLWQWRKPAPDFSFLTGSCAYINEAPYERPRPYGLDSTIFLSMAKERSAFMLWLGDNWYTRESDYYSEWGMHYRPSKDRSLKEMQPFLKAMSHYAIWDDHDYGPNNADKSFIFKKTSRQVFISNWCNPSFGEDEQGVYTKFTYNDVDLFLLDDRWFRSNDETPDSVNGQPNNSKKMFGDKQMEWFKTAMRQSKGNPNIGFRVVAIGSQVLNPVSPGDCLRHFPGEYNEILAFLADEQVEGILFVTGDRHLSEINRLNRNGGYPLYDVTVSPLTAGFGAHAAQEENNPSRILSVEKKQNYARFSFSGSGAGRKLTVEFLGLKGEKLKEWSVLLKDLSYSK